MLSSAKIGTIQDTVNHQDFANNKCLRINSCIEDIYRNWINSYEDFYGIQGENGSRHSSEELQTILRLIPTHDLIKILKNSSAFIKLIDEIAPGELPDKYRTPAFEISFSASGVNVGPLKDAWLPPENAPEGEADVL